MNAFKEITMILLGIIGLFGGLGLILNAKLLNGIILIGAVMIVAGISVFIYLARKAMVEK